VIREEALGLVKQMVSNQNLVKHMLSVEACMRKLAGHFAEDVEMWGLAGLLHDVDYDQTSKDFEQHGLKAAEILEAKGVDPKIVYAVKAHCGKVPAVSRMDKALYAIDPITGLIVASALMAPGKKLAAVDREFVLRRFKEKKFAAGANREQIATCSELGLTLDDFAQMCVAAMQDIAGDIGL
jgi:putative nucleotidyltransferase with HDIG domain